jgi:hypothetical protein
MASKIRFKCPCCGMVSDIDRIHNRKPFKIQVFKQEFGGKIAGQNKGRGKAEGYMRYTNITRSSIDLVREIQEMVNKVYETMYD